MKIKYTIDSDWYSDQEGHFNTNDDGMIREFSSFNDALEAFCKLIEHYSSIEEVHSIHIGRWYESDDGSGMDGWEWDEDLVTAHIHHFTSVEGKKKRGLGAVIADALMMAAHEQQAAL